MIEIKTFVYQFENFARNDLVLVDIFVFASRYVFLNLYAFRSSYCTTDMFGMGMIAAVFKVDAYI